MANNNGCFGWDDVIENDGSEFITLPEGDYSFKVVGFERGRFPGSAKIPACNKAELTLEIKTREGTANVRTDLILYTSLEWKISAFFRSIGQKKKGQKLKPNWNMVLGSFGCGHIIQRKYTDHDGNERVVNDVAYYIDKDSQINFANNEDLPF